MFLSTCEPLEQDGTSKDQTKSLCNPYVFNTAISRAKSLVVAVGNPFVLFKVEEVMGSRRHCWKEYLKLCLDNSTVFFPKQYNKLARSNLIASLRDAVKLKNQDFSCYLIEKRAEKPSNKKQETEYKPALKKVEKLKYIPATDNPKISYAEALKSDTKSM